MTRFGDDNSFRGPSIPSAVRDHRSTHQSGEVRGARYHRRRRRCLPDVRGLIRRQQSHRAVIRDDALLETFVTSVVRSCPGKRKRLAVASDEQAFWTAEERFEAPLVAGAATAALRIVKRSQHKLFIRLSKLFRECLSVRLEQN